MMKQRCACLAGCLALVLVGCTAQDNENNEDINAGSKGTQDQSDGGADDIVIEDDTNASFRGEPCADVDPDTEAYDYGTDYPAGPYGFKGSMCYSVQGDIANDPDNATISLDWKGGGDTMHNICLPNQDGDEICLADFYKGDYDVLVIGYDALWCSVCQEVALNEKDLRAAFAEAGWKVMWISIIVDGIIPGTPAVQADAAEWHEVFSQEFDTLYDNTLLWADRAVIDSWGDLGWGEYGRWQLPNGPVGVPFHFYVNLHTMRVWDRFDGWFGATVDEIAANELLMLNEAKGKPGS